MSTAFVAALSCVGLSGCTNEDTLTIKHNDARKAAGLPALWREGGAPEAWAKAQSQAMANAGALFHSNLKNYGWPPGWRILGENVGVAGTGDIDGMFNAFMNSPEHRANILSGRYTHFAIGFVDQGGRTWCTVGFKG